MSNEIIRISNIASEHKEVDTVMYAINKENLKQSARKMASNKAVGIDNITKSEYIENLESNIEDLIKRMKRMAYVPKAVRRVYIPKAGSDKKRPLGIPAFEDKIVQDIMAQILEVIYEPMFKDFSYGFRPKRSCHQGLIYCNELFKIEEEIANLSVDEKLKARQEKSKPVVEKFYEWVSSTMEKTVLNNKLKKALTYVTNQRKELTEFLNDGRIPLSNNLAERSIRPFAIHRKNWLFADSVEGAKANATMYSIIESAKINKLKIEKYLLDELPQLENINDETVLEKYLPWSKELPEEIQNYIGEYKELKLD